MRGQYSLFNNLLQNPATPQIKNPTIGRSKDLISKRDKRLLYRYYFYIRIQRFTYQEAISRLNEEFDLSESRIVICLTQKTADLKQIIEEKPAVKLLKSLYPWMNWSVLMTKTCE
jgi:hypothetical protein